jgi:HlyD family secretion protein
VNSQESGTRSQGVVMARAMFLSPGAKYLVLSTQHAVLALLALVSISLTGCTVPLAAELKAAGDAAAPIAPGGSLEVVIVGKPVRKTLVLTSSQPARIAAIEQAPLRSKLAGYVEKVLVDYGDKVEAGQPLIKLSVPELEIELVQKQALIDQAQSEVVQAEAAKRAAESAVLAAQSKIKEAEARLTRTEADVERWHLQCKRFKELAESGSVNKQLVEEAEQNCQAAEAADLEAQAAVESVKAAVVQAQAGVETAEADIAAAQARRRVAEANLKAAETMLSYGQITAPFNGTVTRRGVDPGHFVQPATASDSDLLVVARTDVMRVFVAIPEHEAPFVDLGDKVTIEVQSQRGAEFEGKVTRTSFSLDDASRSLETIIDIDNRDGRLRPGMYALAKITLDERKNALTLPAVAVVREGKQAFCYRLVNAKAAKTPIQLGIRVGDDFEVQSGIADGDEVILNKASSLKDSQAVEATPPPPPAK